MPYATHNAGIRELCAAVEEIAPALEAIHLSDPIQRALRDLNGSGQHYVASNQRIEDCGKALLEPGEAV